MLTIYRKLKDYMYEDDNSIRSIFGTLMSSNCVYNYKDSNGNYIDWSCRGIYNKDKDFLLDYYVVGIWPCYKIKDDKIIAFNVITLKSEEELLKIK